MDTQIQGDKVVTTSTQDLTDFLAEKQAQLASLQERMNKILQDIQSLIPPQQ